MGKFILGCIFLAFCVWLGFMALSLGVGLIALIGNGLHWLFKKIVS